MKVLAIVCIVATGFVAAAEEWTFEVEADAPRVVSCKVGRDWTARMATNDVAYIGANGTATPVPWALDTTGDQPEPPPPPPGRVALLRDRHGIPPRRHRRARR